MSRVERWLPGLGILLALGVAWWYRDTLRPLLTTTAVAREAFLALGAWAPLAFILLDALQIVVAPLPGYPIYVAAGYVFGPWAGGLYATLGMALGGWAAATLARVFGRPLVARLVGEENLRHWEHMVHADSRWTWAVAMLAPTGDIPFHLAGLSSLPVWEIVVLGVSVRGPAVFLLAALGANMQMWIP